VTGVVSIAVKVNQIEELLIGSVSSTSAIDSRVDAAVRRIWRHPCGSLTDLSDEIGLGARQLRRRLENDGNVLFGRHDVVWEKL